MARDLSEELSSVLRFSPEDGSTSDTSVGVAVKTLLVVELVDRAGLFERFGDERAFEVLERHDDLVEDLVTRFDGREIEESDGFLLLFQRPVDAVRCALAYHDGLAGISGEVGLSVRGRAGMHAGEVFLRINPPEEVSQGARPVEAEGYAKLIAAETASVASGGQTLLTRGIYDLSRPSLEDDAEVVWAEHGRRDFRGLSGGIEVFEVGRRGMAPFFPPPGMAAARHRWSRRVAALAAAAAAAVAAALAVLLLFPEDGRRLSVAILGPGNLSGRAEDAWLETALAELLASELGIGGRLAVIPGKSIARLRRDLDLEETRSTLTDETLSTIRDILGNDYVIVGNYMVLPADGDIRLQLYVQSTTGGEDIRPVDALGRVSNLLELVTEAGSAVRNRFGIGSAAVSEEELARVAPEEETLQLYFEGLRRLRELDALSAQKNLLAAVEAEPDYALAHAALSEAYLALGMERSAQESAQWAFDLSLDLPQEERLRIKGLFYETSDDWPQAIETYRALWDLYPETLDYGIQLAKAQNQASRPEDALATVASLRSLPPPQGEDPRIDLAEAAAAKTLSQVWKQLEATERAYEKGRRQKSRTLIAEALLFRGHAYHQLGRYPEQQTAYEEALLHFTEAGDRARVARVTNGMGVLAGRLGDLATAEERYHQALEIYEELGHRKGVSQIRNNLGVLMQSQGELQNARQLVEQSLAIAQELAKPAFTAIKLDSLAGLLLAQGDLDAAQRTAEKAMNAYVAGGERQGPAWIHYLQGNVSLARGGLEEAEKHYEAGAAIAAQREVKSLSGHLARARGELHVLRAELEEGRRYLEAAQLVCAEVDEMWLLAETHLALARYELASGQLAKAEALLRDSAAEYRGAGWLDSQLAAAAARAETLVALGKTSAARQALMEAGDDRRSQNPWIRIVVDVAEARLLAAEGQQSSALAQVETPLAEASGLGFLQLSLEARLARAEIAGTQSQSQAADLMALIEDARRAGYEEIARRAESLAL